MHFEAGQPGLAFAGRSGCPFGLSGKAECALKFGRNDRVGHTLGGNSKRAPNVCGPSHWLSCHTSA